MERLRGNAGLSAGFVAGFTKVELLVVMSIMAISTTLALPGFMGWLPNYRLKGAVRDLAPLYVDMTTVTGRHSWSGREAGGLVTRRYRSLEIRHSEDIARAEILHGPHANHLALCGQRSTQVREGIVVVQNEGRRQPEGAYQSCGLTNVGANDDGKAAAVYSANFTLSLVFQSGALFINTMP